MAYPTVLVLDDNADAAEAIAFLLETHGWPAVASTSVEGALDALDENSKIGVVVSDIRMPTIDGFDFLRVVKHRFPTVPVILMTGRPIEADDLIPSTATILQNPFPIQHLFTAIAEKRAGLTA